MTNQIADSLRIELSFIWQAQKSLGLNGVMRLFSSRSETAPWRPNQSGIEFWFNENQIEEAISQLLSYYNEAKLPNTPLLLDPVVYDLDGKIQGTALVWTTALYLLDHKDFANAENRLKSVGVMHGGLAQGDNNKAGWKVLGVAQTVQKPDQKGDFELVNALFELINMPNSVEYKNYHLLSGVRYLSQQGMYTHDNFVNLFEEKFCDISNVSKYQVNEQKIKDAAKCWIAYDRHQSLYSRFGIDAGNLKNNLTYYNLCARDFELLDATGPQRQGAEQTFEFLVPGWVPRGAITLIAGTGGTGKSSLAHNLAVKAAIDYQPGETPTWLSQPINLDYSKNGICVYFSGEDGPAIVNARAKMFDPEGRAKRLMFQRTDFGMNSKGEKANLDEFLERLRKMPDVPLLVIDPARKYLEGDEDDSEVVSNFFEAIEEFAITKNSAVIVVHHLAKGAKPSNSREMLDLLRGSQVFIDRPRVVIGLYRDGPYTVAGLSKNNIPPNLGMVQGERVFVRDGKALELVQLPGKEGIRDDSLTPEELEELKSKSE